MCVGAQITNARGALVRQKISIDGKIFEKYRP